MAVGVFRTPQVVVVFAGQSLNINPTSSFPDTYPAQTMVSYPRIGFGVPAIGGKSWTTLAGTAPFARATRYITTAPKTVLVMCGGTTDFADFGEGDDAGTVNSDMATYAVSWRSAVTSVGKSATTDTYVINTTTTPSATITGNDSSRSTSNAYLTTDAFGQVGTTYWNAVVDFAGHANLSNNLNTTYYNVDAIHWVAAGCSVAAGLMVPALATAFSFLGVTP